MLPLLLTALLSSCATVYKCGDPKPEKVPITWSKNMKAVVNERDKLCTGLALKEKKCRIEEYDY